MSIMDWIAQKIVPNAIIDFRQDTASPPAKEREDKRRRIDQDKERAAQLLAALSAEAQMHERLLQ